MLVVVWIHNLIELVICKGQSTALNLRNYEKNPLIIVPFVYIISFPLSFQIYEFWGDKIKWLRLNSVLYILRALF